VKSALRNDLERLRRDALSERHRHAFETGRAKQPAIAAHADAASVLAMLDDEAEGTYASREALTEAIIREHRGRITQEIHALEPTLELEERRIAHGGPP